MTDSSGNKVTYNYNQTKGTLDSVVDPKGKQTSYGHDNNDRLTSVSKMVSGETVQNSYTYENDRIKTINHNDFYYKFDYDNLGNVSEVKVKENRSLIKNTYAVEAGGGLNIKTNKLQESEYGNGQKVGYQYDILDRIMARTYNGSTRHWYTYDSAGNLGYHDDIVNGVKYRYVYDLANRLSEVR
ncbi:hypothetical protein, partial [Oxobacter pfennigii]|uniref:hypothetical protein n=1 Tax=Oxobacter pfennigii TaxID=36849 RepID=UPI001364C785